MIKSERIGYLQQFCGKNNFQKIEHTQITKNQAYKADSRVKKVATRKDLQSESPWVSMKELKGLW